MSSLDDLGQKRMLAALVFAGLTVSVMSTLGTPLIPTIADEQHVSLDTAQWMLTVTLLVGAIATPVLGRLGDGPQRRRVLLVTLGSAFAGSVVAATSTRFPQLLAGRALQGVGYGTVPLAIALTREHVTGDRLRSGIAMLSITVAVGAGLGFPVTGLIAQTLDFHAAFWFGAIFAAAAFVSVALAVPRATGEAKRVALDVPGALLLAGGLASLLLGISQGESLGWASAAVVALFAGAAALLAAWVHVELRRDAPLVDLRLVSQRAILGANVAALLLAMGMYIAMSLVNRLMQTPESTGYGFGATLVTTGLMLLPLSLGSLVSQQITRRVIRRYGIGVVLPAGALIVAATLLWLAVAHGRLLDIAIATALLGVGVGCSFAAMPALIVASVPEERTGSATSLNQVLRSVGGALGSAVGVAILAAHHPAATPFPQESGYTIAFLVGAVVCVVTAGLAILLAPRRRPAAVVAPRFELEQELLMEEAAVGAGVGPSVFDGERRR
ncbi:MFS transporter [Conexibacter woesei]|uniref:Major facilitator superfamily MFS_1 n=1 Tax=Conexibacter woesei (strain DSM 14684 / CCUG 47730 / CIP 108061 / JCM 11494 / NBRC 100937 / ID131577) TaxID=469383 RepID=D3FB05_CONWI|nr:MFS transporter [Conexibacter woesei]ADB53197.1 major facilitator superfamily MFS_1 [Conexibacter woesei DSM 14684]